MAVVERAQVEAPAALVGHQVLRRNWRMNWLPSASACGAAAAAASAASAAARLASASSGSASSASRIARLPPISARRARCRRRTAAPPARAAAARRASPPCREAVAAQADGRRAERGYQGGHVVGHRRQRRVRVPRRGRGCTVDQHGQAGPQAFFDGLKLPPWPKRPCNKRSGGSEAPAGPSSNRVCSSADEAVESGRARRRSATLAIVAARAARVASFISLRRAALPPPLSPLRSAQDFMRAMSASRWAPDAHLAAPSESALSSIGATLGAFTAPSAKISPRAVEPRAERVGQNAAQSPTSPPSSRSSCRRRRPPLRRLERSNSIDMELAGFELPPMQTDLQPLPLTEASVHDLVGAFAQAAAQVVRERAAAAAARAPAGAAQRAARRGAARRPPLRRRRPPRPVRRPDPHLPPPRLPVAVDALPLQRRLCRPRRLRRRGDPHPLRLPAAPPHLGVPQPRQPRGEVGALGVRLPARVSRSTTSSCTRPSPPPSSTSLATIVNDAVFVVHGARARARRRPARPPPAPGRAPLLLRAARAISPLAPTRFSPATPPHRATGGVDDDLTLDLLDNAPRSEYVVNASGSGGTGRRGLIHPHMRAKMAELEARDLALRPINSALWNDPHGQLEGTAPNKVRLRTPLRPHTATPDLTPRIPHI